MSKTMYLIRHADRIGNRLTDRGLAEAREFGKSLGNRNFTLVYSSLPWSWETVQGIIPSLDFVHVQGKEKRLSPDRLFAEMFPAAVENLMEERQLPALLAIAEHFDGEKIHGWKAELADSIRQMFDELPPAGVCIAIGHDPYIQLAVGGLGGDVPRDMLRLSSFQGFRITQENNGSIRTEPYRWPEETL
jgi:broad specificity phosphatase PhoE